jgi:hypothetical protein
MNNVSLYSGQANDMPCVAILMSGPVTLVELIRDHLCARVGKLYWFCMREKNETVHVYICDKGSDNDDSKKVMTMITSV